MPKLVYLLNDADTAISNGYPGSATTLSNSQCSLDLLHATTTGTAGNDLYLNLPIAFSASFGGASRNIYQSAYDHLGQYVGWTQTGSWIVAGPFLTITTTSLPAGNANVAIRRRLCLFKEGRERGTAGRQPDCRRV